MKSKSESRKTVLANGVRIITESLPVRTVSVGIWVDVGSRDEDETTSGSAHFVEHMLFKGTPSRDAIQIARDLDALGGAGNAFTSKESTCLYATVLDRQVPLLFPLLADLFLHSSFDTREIIRERSVILQEIDMVQESPEELIMDYFSTLVWQGHPIARSVLGDAQVVESMTQERLRAFVTKHYSPDSIVVVAAGGIEHDSFVQLVQEQFSSVEKLQQGTVSRQESGAENVHEVRRTIYQRPFEQAHIALGMHALSACDSLRYTLLLLNIILGGNMSSRLFQEIREKRGLAYSIFSFVEPYADGGILGVYTGVHPQKALETVYCIERIIGEIVQNGFTADELRRAQEYAQANLYLSAENMDARMMRLAKNEYIFGKHIALYEVEEHIAAVSLDGLNSLAGRLLAPPLNGVLLGPVTANDELQGWLAAAMNG